MTSPSDNTPQLLVAIYIRHPQGDGTTHLRLLSLQGVPLDAAPPPVFPAQTIPEFPDLYQAVLTPADIYRDVEKALRLYHFRYRLRENPLLQKLDLRRWATSDLPPELSLKAALDEVINGMTGDLRQIPNYGIGRLGFYLHLRYRERETHSDLARTIGYSERQLNDIRHQMILDLAARLLELTQHP